MTTVSPPPRVPLRLVAVPAEHGGWGFLLEPIVLGLLAAPTLPGALLGVAALGAFLTRHPLKLALNDRRRGKRYPRTRLAEKFAVAYGALTVLALALSLWHAPAIVLLPAVLAAPLAFVQLRFDALNKSREALPEVVGALALAATAPMIALLGGVGLLPALALWAVLACRSAPSILYVRARLRLERGQPARPALVIAAHLAALGGVLAGVLAGVLPALALAAALALLARAAHGLSRFRRPVRPTVIGVREMLFGLGVVLLVGFGVRP